ncbi:MAG: hypothetical protein ACFE9R_18110 [Candidatus Hermodarchaeota archaeon]
MKKKSFFLLLLFIGILVTLSITFSTAKPGFGDTHDACHYSPAYTISTNVSSEIQTEPNTVIYFNISATGSNLFVQFIPGAKDNDLFNVDPTTNRINDSTLYDSDPTLNSITTQFNITTPMDDGYYTIFIIAGDNSTGQISFAYLEIAFNVGGVLPPQPEVNVFNHFEMYFGITALILLSVGTILVLINENKFVKIHGYLSGASWILTLVNVIFLVSLNPNVWSAFNNGIHWPHIILGGFGLLTGLLSMIFGIAAERKYAKLTGYITLICWWGAFFSGLIVLAI